MSGRDWLLIETLRDDIEPTLVADGATFKDWSGLLRTRREIRAAAPQRITEVVRDCVTTGRTVSCLDEDPAIVAVPVRCAFDEVHGVQVWVGAPGGQPPPCPQVAAWDWDAVTELAHHGPGLEELVFARDPALARVIRTPPEAFGKMVRFAGRVEYFDMVGALDGRWQGDVDMIGDDHQVRNFQMITRADPRARRIRALMHRIADLGLVRPDVDMEIMRAVSQRADDGLGFVSLTSSLIYEWTRTPPPPLDRWAIERPKLHPDDARAFRSACADLAHEAEAAGPTAGRQLSFRVRFTGTDWMRVRAELMPMMPRASGHGLVRVWHEPAE